MIKKILNVLKRVEQKSEEEKSVYDKIDELFYTLNPEVITISVGEDFVDFEDIVLNTISTTRNQLSDKTGFILPPVKIKMLETLQENEIIVKIREKEILQKFVIPNQVEIEKEIRESLEYLFENHLDDIFTYEIAEKYINSVQQNHWLTIFNITSTYSITEIRNVLLELLKNKRSIKNINYLFEKFADVTLDGIYTERLSTQKIAQKLTKFL